MTVCITGATGFIGSALAARLLAEGVRVRALARPSPRADRLEACGAEIVRGDIEDAISVARAVSGADVVYHAAAKVEGLRTKEQFMETNVAGTQRILEACAQHGARHVVYLSSIAVYGPILPGRPIDEDTPFDDRPEERDFYAQSKIAGDRLVIDFARKTNLAITILRPGIVFGPGRALPVGMLAARIGKFAIVCGDARQRIALNYIDNFVDAIVLVGSADRAGLRDYIVVDDEDLTLGAYHRARRKFEGGWTIFIPPTIVVTSARVGRVVPTKDGVFSPRQAVRATQDRHYDTSRIRKEIGWSPKVSLEDAIARTLQAKERI